jgi:ACS family glucarate transporter-like MFS transporter
MARRRDSSGSSRTAAARIARTVTPPSPTAQGSEGSSRPTRVRFEVVAAACLLAFIAYVHRNGFAWAGTYLKAELRLSDSHWSFVMVAFLLGYGLFEIPWGLLGDRFGPRHLLAISVLGWSLLTAAASLVHFAGDWPYSFQLAFLISLRFLFGAFQAGAFPTIARLLADWMPLRERGTAQGLIWMASRTGGAVAPLVMVPLVQWRGWPAALAILSSLGAVWCAASWPWIRNRPEQSDRVGPAELGLIARGRSRQSGSHAGFPWRRLLRSGNTWALFAMYACGGCTATFFITLLPDYLRVHRRLSDAEAKWVSSVPLACGIAACLLGGVLSDWFIRRTGDRKWGRRLNGVVGYTGSGLAILSTIWVTDVWALGALFSAAFLLFDLTMGPAWAACADIGERHAGTLGGAMNMIGNFGAATGAYIAGSLFGTRVLGFEGNDVVFVVFACALWLGALCWLRVDVTRKLDPTEAELPT